MTELAGGRPIRPVILAGGAGTRLWPLSTIDRPKHLLPLLGEQTLLQRTLRRFGDGFTAPIIVANRAQEAELREACSPDATIILEPVKRDSAPAIALAALAANGDELLLVAPSDHHIGDVAAFHAAIALARPAAEAGRIVTFGIEPNHPATGYGYIAAGQGSGVRPVARFVEKPDEDVAEAMIDQGGHYWNAGIFLALTKTWRDELERHAPQILAAARDALGKAVRDDHVVRVDEEAFAASPAKSIDYAVMEHSTQVSVAPVNMGWSDVGSWAAVFDAAKKGDGGNVVTGDVLVIDSYANLIRSDGPKVAAIGVDDLVIVATGNAVLVTRLEHAQRVREAAEWFEEDFTPSRTNPGAGGT